MSDALDSLFLYIDLMVHPEEATVSSHVCILGIFILHLIFQRDSFTFTK